MLLRYAIAGVDAEALAQLGQVTGLSGSITTGQGFGKWGVEPTVFLDMYVGGYEDMDRADQFVARTLARHGQESALRVRDGHAASLVKSNGDVDGL